MKLRVADQLANFGCTVSVSEFRTVLATVKAELYPSLTDEHLAFTRHAAERYCAAVREKVGGKKLPRVFILQQLVGLRKSKPKTRKIETVI